MKRFLALLSCSLGLASCSTTKQPDLTTVDHVDLPRFMGDWYVFAHIPYSLEEGKVGTLDRYALREDGSLDNIFMFRRETLDAPLEQWNGRAWIHNKETNAEWRVQFVWPIKLKYFIIDLDEDDYQWAVIGYPNRKLGWVLSRETSLDEEVYAGILERLKEQGYDPAAFRKVPQRSD